MLRISSSSSVLSLHNFIFGLHEVLIHSYCFTFYLDFNKLTKIDFDFVLDLEQVTMEENDTDVDLGTLEICLLEIISQTTKEECELQAQQKIYETVSSKSNAFKLSFLTYHFFPYINSFS